MSTTPEPRLALANTRGSEFDLTAPLPSALAAQVAKRAEQHAQVVARLTAHREQVMELSRQLAEQERIDSEQATEAALVGESPPRRQKAASVRKKLSEAEGEARAFETAVRRSAQALLVAAVPHVGDALDAAQHEHEQALRRGRELLAATDQALADADRAAAETWWLADLAAGSPSIEPYREGVSGMVEISRLRGALQQAAAEFDHRHAEQEVERERQRAWEVEQQAEAERHAERMRREDEARRVVTEGGAIVAIGGRPVRKGGFGPIPDDDEGETAAEQ
jgi:hypothetical protein